MADAIFRQTVLAAGKLVQTLGTSFPPTFETYLRRKPIVLESDAAPPLVVICPGNDGEAILQTCFGGTVVYGYPVIFMVVTKGNTIVTGKGSTTDWTNAGSYTQADTDTINHMAIREAVRNAVWKNTLSGVTSVWKASDPVMGEPMTIAAGTGTSLYLVSAMTVTYWSSETQTY